MIIADSMFRRLRSLIVSRLCKRRLIVSRFADIAKNTSSPALAEDRLLICYIRTGSAPA